MPRPRTILSHARAVKTGFTLIELLVVIAIISMLMSMVLPGIQAARAAARSLKCKDHLRNFGQAYKNYHSQGNTSRVAANMWMGQLREATQSVDAVLHCPEEAGEGAIPIPYVMYARGSDSLRRIDFVPGAEFRRADLTPGVFQMRIDSSSSASFNDIVIHCTEVGDGTVTFSFVSVDGGSQIDIYDADDTSLAKVAKGATSGPSGKFKARSGVDYGMNARCHRLDENRDSRKVLMVDYKDAIADVVSVSMINTATQDVTTRIAPHVFATKIAPRHSGMVNVLYLDGHTDSVMPDDIDPTDQSLHDEHWKPHRDVAPWQASGS